MTAIQFLSKQTEDVYKWTNTLIETIPLDKWDTMPDTIESTINWQVGHLIMSHYFHSIMVITGHQPDILQKIPIKEYSELFSTASPRKSVNRISSSDLFNELKIIQQKSLSIVYNIPPSELTNRLEPTPMPHPVAKTKFEAIDWNIKHTMYHCGQIGIIRRVIFERFDFGLRVSK